MAYGPVNGPGMKGATGAQGATGANGKSAYQIACENGFVGTEAAWLASLKGDKGDTGPQGPAGTTPDMKKFYVTAGLKDGETASFGSTVEGSDNSVRGTDSDGNNSFGSAAHVEGRNNISCSNSTHVEGQSCTANERWAHAGGYNSIASGEAAFAQGWPAKATADCAVALAGGEASAKYACAVGYSVKAGNYASFVCGKYSKSLTGGEEGRTAVGDAFVVGNGTVDSRNFVQSANALRVTYAGEVYGTSAFKSTGADYAEYFEWADGNPNGHDRVGYFVTLDGKKIRIAGPGDYIHGIISGQPCMIGNADEDWLGRWLHDEFGRFIMEYVEITREKISIPDNMSEQEEYELSREVDVERRDGQYYRVIEKVVDYKTQNYRFKLNPDYDSNQQYIERKDRPEWSPVGMLGVLSVRDDGTCFPNGFCAVADGGIATVADSEFSIIDGKIRKGYRVLERVTENVIKIAFR